MINGTDAVMFAIDTFPNELHLMSYNEKDIDHLTSCHWHISNFRLLTGSQAQQIEYHRHCFHGDTH